MKDHDDQGSPNQQQVGSLHDAPPQVPLEAEMWAPKQTATPPRRTGIDRRGRASPGRAAQVGAEVLDEYAVALSFPWLRRRREVYDFRAPERAPHLFERIVFGLPAARR